MFHHYRRLSCHENVEHVKSDHSSPTSGLRINATTPLLALNAFMTCTGTALRLPLSWWHQLPSVFRQRQTIFLRGPLPFCAVTWDVSDFKQRRPTDRIRHMKLICIHAQCMQKPVMLTLHSEASVMPLWFSTRPPLHVT
jgi:hypothetical protein